jgi:hypothetical protein
VVAGAIVRNWAMETASGVHHGGSSSLGLWSIGEMRIIRMQRDKKSPIYPVQFGGVWMVGVGGYIGPQISNFRVDFHFSYRHLIHIFRLVNIFFKYLLTI